MKAITKTCTLMMLSFIYAAVAAEPMKTAEQILRDAGYASTLTDLRRALHSDDRRIRIVAAYRLIEVGEPNAATVISEQVNKTSNTFELVQLSGALLSVSPAQASTKLFQVCADTTTGEEMRLEAFRLLLDRGMHECDLNAVSILQRTNNAQTRVLALALMTGKAVNVDPVQLEQIEELNLKSSDPNVRVAAGRALARRTDSNAAEALNRQIVQEQDSEVRQQLQSASNNGHEEKNARRN